MLKIAQFGNPVLRQKAASLSVKDISNQEIQALVSAMRELLLHKKLGIGLAAPQVGVTKRVAVVSIRPSKLRPEAQPFDLVIINPRITATEGKRKQLYEGCISGGASSAGLFARVPRYKKLTLNYYDEHGNNQEKTFEGLIAHVIQHEVDHLDGILFVDRVRDTKSYMTRAEYLKYVKNKLGQKR